MRNVGLGSTCVSVLNRRGERVPISKASWHMEFSDFYVTWDETWLDQVDVVGGWCVFVYNNKS